MPARTALVLALLACPLVASAQPTLLASRGPVAAAAASVPLTPYLGTYTTPGGSVELVETQGSLQILATGAPVAAALTRLSPSDAALDARAAFLLNAWVGGDVAPLAASVRSDRQPVAEAHFTTSRSALTRRLGDVRSAEVIGTFRQTDGHRATLARIAFEHGTQWMSLVWTGTDELATLKRGLNPVIAGHARPTTHDRFESGGTALTFGRDANGRVSSLRVGARFEATR